jgi:hypothetical protein
VIYPLHRDVTTRIVPAKRGGFDLDDFKESAGITGHYIAGTQFKAGHNME